MTAAPLLRVEGLRAGYGPIDALHDVSMSVASGSSVAILGHNGAGKTTLLKLIAGVTAPSRGSVAVTGRIAALIDVMTG